MRILSSRKYAGSSRRGQGRLPLRWVVVRRLTLAGASALLIAVTGYWEQAFGNPSGITNIFRPLSQPAQEIKEISILVLAICAVIFSVVAGLLVYTIIRYRHRKGDEASEPPQIYGSNQIETAWTVLPILIVFVLILVTSRSIANIQGRQPTSASIHSTIVGHQWWWEIRYPELGIVTANELHVPASTESNNQPTFLKLQSADVAHSFWVPQLAGKTDLIPNRENLMWIAPTQTGTYLGNCAEYCGMQHAHMLLRVIVHTPGEFERWVKEQQRPAVEEASASEGRRIFFGNSCVSCHAIRGTSAKGVFGPDLTHLMSRQTLASGAALNSHDSLRAWIRDPQQLKVGCLMPNMQMSDKEVDQVVAYLETLR
jgi:cytochrome c oxidase subunit II